MIQVLFGASLLSCTDVSQWTLKDGTLQWSKSINQSWSCQFVLRDLDGLMLAQVGRPKVGQPFWITETINNVRTIRFSGLLTSVQEQAYPSTNALQWQCQSKGWSTVCDHRVVTAEYDAGEPSLNIYQDIFNNTISADGITFADVDGFTLLPQPLKFNPKTVTDCLNELRTLTGQQWWIDENKGLHAKDPQLINNSWITISDATGNWLNGSMQVTTTSDNYRNVEYEMTSSPVSTISRVDTFVATGPLDFFLVTAFPIDSAPIVTVNGVSQTIKQFGVDAFGQDAWYWQQGSSWVQQGQQIAPAAGSIVVVTYDSINISYTVDENSGEVATRAAIEGTSGKWEHIDSQADVQTADVGHAYGQGQLANFAVIPQVVKFDTYQPGFDVQLGKYVVFALSLHNLFGKYVITDVSASEEPEMVAPEPIGAGNTMKYTVTVTNQAFTGNYIQWFLGLVASLKNAQAAAVAASQQNLPANTTTTGSGQQWIQEVPAGAMNSSNTTFTTTFVPVPNSLQLLLNGVMQNPFPDVDSPAVPDYTLSGKTITYDHAPKATDHHFVRYQITLGTGTALSPGSSATIPGVVGTGLLTDGVTLAALGSTDVNWILAVSPDLTYPGPAAIVSTHRPSNYIANQTTSQWINPEDNPNAVDNTTGSYTWRITFNMSGLDPTTAQIVGQFAADDDASIVLNGVTVIATSGNAGSFTSFTISSHFIAGVNTLDFISTNASAPSPNPTGIQVKITSATAKVV